jgi:replicative DNA helicase Mcm
MAEAENKARDIPTEMEGDEIGSFLNEKCREELNLVGQLYPDKQSVIINFQQLAEYSPQLSEMLISSPDEVISDFHKAIEKEKSHIAFARKIDDEPRVYVRFIGLPAENEIMVRECTSEYLNKFFSMQGLVTTTTDILPKVWKGVFKCKRCKAETSRIQPKKGIEQPMVCESCGRHEFDMDEERSKYIDFQKIQVQEPLEILKGGDQAKRISVWLEEDLVKKRIVPGQRIIITGSLRLEPPKPSKVKSPIYQKYVEANNVEFTEQEFEELEITEAEEKEIKKLSKDPKVYDKIIASVAPSIYGHTEAKEAVMLQLCGGASHKKLPDGTKIRDSIHILMIGDPGTAKSQILKYVDRLAPKSLYVSGKSATGGGLTAIAEKDEFGEGGWVLKAGALVLASGGMACIDEFDKMSEEDRSAIHEALEQQTVSVAKAGIIATFRSESAVLAAANPKYSRYDPYKPPAEQFNIPASLISRFDLIFPIKDVLDETKDRNLATHMLNAHTLSQTLAADSTANVEEMKKDLVPPVDQDLLKKYVAYGRRNCHPILTKEASDRLGNYYVDLRKRSSGGAVALTPRQLEGLVRLSEASAKVRLSRKVEMQDADRAIRLVEFVLREIGMEKEGGGFDIDRIMSDHPKSERDKIYTITGIVKGLEEEYDMVPMQRVVEEAQEFHNIDQQTSEKLIRELLNKGDLYEPRHGHIKTVRQ